MYLRGKFGYTDMIKNLVFDFGGVLTAIDTKQAIERFRNLGLQNPEEYLNAYKQTGIFFQLYTLYILSRHWYFGNSIRSRGITFLPRYCIFQ